MTFSCTSREKTLFHCFFQKQITQRWRKLLGLTRRLSPRYWTEGFWQCQGARKSLLLLGLPSAFGQCSTFSSSCNICWHKYAHTEEKMGKRHFACHVGAWAPQSLWFISSSVLKVGEEVAQEPGALCPSAGEATAQAAGWYLKVGVRENLSLGAMCGHRMFIDTQPCNSCSCCLLLADVFWAGCCWVGWQGEGKHWSHICCRCCSEIQKTTVIQQFHAGFQSQHCRACSNFSLYTLQALLWHSSC